MCSHEKPEDAGRVKLELAEQRYSGAEGGGGVRDVCTGRRPGLFSERRGNKYGPRVGVGGAGRPAGTGRAGRSWWTGQLPSFFIFLPKSSAEDVLTDFRKRERESLMCWQPDLQLPASTAVRR